MGKYKKLLNQILIGSSDTNIEFQSLCILLEKMNFSRRVKGDHYIFFRDGVEEIINIQPAGNKAKPYQVKQIRNIILKYNMGDTDV